MLPARDLFSYRKHWASRFGTAPFLPMSREEMEALGWDSCDIIVVTAAEGTPHAVLLRALEPVERIDATSHGPGLLCRAMGIDRTLNRADLLGPTLWIETPAGYRPPRISRSTRIGVDYAGDWARRPWRFFDRDSPYVSTVSPAQRKRALAGT